MLIKGQVITFPFVYCIFLFILARNFDYQKANKQTAFYRKKLIINSL